jgi:hypothetical protein
MKIAALISFSRKAMQSAANCRLAFYIADSASAIGISCSVYYLGGTTAAVARPLLGKTKEKKRAIKPQTSDWKIEMGTFSHNYYHYDNSLPCFFRFCFLFFSLIVQCGTSKTNTLYYRDILP